MHVHRKLYCFKICFFQEQRSVWYQTQTQADMKRKLSEFGAEVTSGEGRKYTVSLAIAGSIIENTQNVQHATLVAAQIARAAAIFCIDEIVVIDDVDKSGYVSAGTALLARILQFMETPQYLRKYLIPLHEDLKQAGTLPPLNTPHHLRAGEWMRYREGVVVEKCKGGGCLLDIGLQQYAQVCHRINVNTRITLEVGTAKTIESGYIQGQVVTPQTPREQLGIYWGYTVRIAQGIDQVFDSCPFEGGYDVKVGTSERGRVINAQEIEFGDFQHLLIGFGGLDGLEKFMQGELTEAFDMYLNTCPGQGSRTIRTEEAIYISLAKFHQAILQNNATEVKEQFADDSSV
eukprot:TRINITY_DN28077_c2_g1_i1.p1 TRINITY_DN28077_c2_g1~~TRINITY_DN28077_c2_g1_i1.p1  ORF type:complete len:346 (-),score=41.89 TRINITY_DN28077_c2_g1_i1:127-1164(-)